VDWLRSLAWLVFGSYLVGLLTTRFYETVWMYPQLATTPILDLSQVLYGGVFTFTVGYTLWAAFTLNASSAHHSKMWVALFILGQLAGLGMVVGFVLGLTLRPYHGVLFAQLSAVQLVLDGSIYWSSRQPPPEVPSAAGEVLAELLALPSALRDQLHNAIAGSFIVVALAIINYSYVPQSFGGGAPVPVLVTFQGTGFPQLRPPVLFLGHRGSYLVLTDSAMLGTGLNRAALFIPESAVRYIRTSDAPSARPQ
jgi:hypothetical protein